MGSTAAGSRRTMPLQDWVALHPQAALVAAGKARFPARGGFQPVRSEALAAALSEANRSWGSDVDGPLAEWLAGAETVVTGQQPGLLGGPLLTLAKACAVAAEVARRRAAGRAAVGFLWLATSDDDLPEMGWARVAVESTLLEAREEAWNRGDRTAAAAVLGDATTVLLDAVAARSQSDFTREAIDLARACFAPGATLGDAAGRFFAALLGELDIVIVDAMEPELGRAAAPVVVKALADLAAAIGVVEDGASAMRAQGWPVPVAAMTDRLPVFRRVGGERERLPQAGGACPPQLLGEIERKPESFLPNVWLRPLVQDAALGTTVSFLGSAELAYHAQVAALWDMVGLARPEWRLRPHLTAVTAAERRLAVQLGVRPEDLLADRLPTRVLPGDGVRHRLGALRDVIDRGLGDVAAASLEELPALKGDVEATRRKLEAATDWLERRLEGAAHQAEEVGGGRWRKLRAFLRPEGRPQERHLSVLAPLLRLGVGWPGALAQALDPEDCGMQLLYWEEGGPW